MEVLKLQGPNQLLPSIDTDGIIKTVGLVCRVDEKECGKDQQLPCKHSSHSYRPHQPFRRSQSVQLRGVMGGRLLSKMPSKASSVDVEPHLLTECQTNLHN